MSRANKLSDRLSTLFNLKTPSSSTSNEKSNANDETSSVTSEITGSDIGKGNSDGLKSWGTRLLNLSDSNADGSIDECMKNLYLDPDILERNCISSMRGEARFDNDASRRNSINEDREAHVKSFTISKTSKDVVNSLPPCFFTSDFDPTESILLEVNNWSTDESITEKFMNKIEETDINKDFVVSKLTETIEANYHELNNCLGDVYMIDTDLLKAEIQITTARRNIALAQTALSDGVMRVAQLQLKKENLVLIKETLKSLYNMKDLYKLMLNNITIGDFARAAESACHVLSCFNEGTYSKFLALDNITSSIQKNLIQLRQRADAALNQLCNRKFTSTEYECVVHAYATLDYMNEVMGYETSDYTSYYTGGIGNNSQKTLTASSDALGCISGIPRRVLFAMIEDVQNCLHNAVLETVSESQVKKTMIASSIRSQYDTNHSNNHTNEEEIKVADLAELETSELFEKITADMVVPFVCRSCEYLSAIIHTRFLINQWHKTPFDGRNHDKLFLHNNQSIYSAFIKPTSNMGHSKPMIGSHDIVTESTDSNNNHLNDDDDDDDVHNDTDNENTLATIQKVLKYSHFRLNTVHHTLVESNVSLWDQVEEGLVEILNSLNISASIPMEDYMSMTWAVHTMIALGHEFCQSPCLLLINSLKLKTKEYFGRQHLESYNMLRQMIENESWYNIPINLADLGGILGIIRKNIITIHDGNNNATGVRSMLGISLGLQFTLDSNHHDTSSSNNNNSNISTKNQPATATTSLNNIQPIQSVFQIFGEYGNPFHFMTESSSSSSGINSTTPIIDEEFTETNNNNDNNNDNNDDDDDIVSSLKLSKVNHKSNYTASTDLLSILMDGDEEISPRQTENTASITSTTNTHNATTSATTGNENKSNHNQRITNNNHQVHSNNNNNNTMSSMVVTQTAMNGLAKYSGKYLQMIHLMPSASSEVFHGLCELFDYYLCAVFVSFIPIEDKNKILTKQGAMTSPPPDQSRDFEALVTFIERALNEVVLTEFISAITTDTTSSGIRRDELLSSRDAQPDSDDEDEGGIVLPTKNDISTVDSLHNTNDNDNNSVTENSNNKSEDVTTNISSAIGSDSTTTIKSISPTPDHQSQSSSSSSTYSATGLLSSGINTGSDAVASASSTMSSSLRQAYSATMSIKMTPSTSFHFPKASSINIPLSSGSSNMSQALPTVPENAETTTIGASNHTIPPDVLKVSSILHASENVQRSNFDSSSMYGLHMRIVAAESCWFASKVLTEIKEKLLKMLPDNMKDKVKSFIEQYQFIAGQLRGLIYRTMCPIIMKSNMILVQIIDSSCGWDSKKIRSEPHEWVTTLTKNCKEVWLYLNKDDHFAEATGVVREQVWLELCQAAFDVVLEAFSRIRKCSTEGKSNMRMDIQSLQYNLDTIHSCKPPRGQHHIDEFIRASTLQEDAMMKWIQENWSIYAYRHIHGLLTMTLKSSVLSSSKKLSESIAVIDKLYEDSEDTKLSNMLTTRLQEESKISSLLSKGIRMTK